MGERFRLDVKDAERPWPLESAADFLLWARENRFSVSSLSIGDVTLSVQDLGAPLPPEKAELVTSDPNAAHRAWAEILGVPFPGDEDDDEPDTPDPVEGQ